MGPTQSYMQRTVILSLGEGGREREAENSANISVTWCGTLPPPMGTGTVCMFSFKVNCHLHCDTG